MLLSSMRHVFSKIVQKEFSTRNCFFLEKSSIIPFYFNNKNNLSSYQSASKVGLDTSKVSTINDAINLIGTYLGIERGNKYKIEDRAHLLPLLPKTQDELPERTMKDSFVMANIPLSIDIAMHEKYVTFLGHVRLGRLMEDMDIFAVLVSLKHIYNPKQKPGDPTSYLIATILVDQIDFTDIVPRHDEDIRIAGHVSWVGKSSIETTIWLEQMHEGTWKKLTQAVFLMAARNSINTGAAIVNRLVPETDIEKEILLKGENRKNHRLKVMDNSLLKVSPNSEEQKTIHGLFLQTIDWQDPSLHERRLPENNIWLEDTKLSNVIFSHPENRNLVNKVFGGFLMRKALELAWSCCYVFTKTRPKLKHISNIKFRKPVEVNSLIQIHSQIVYTEQNFVQIIVYAEVYDPAMDTHNTTNISHYTFQLPENVKQVLPRSYQDAMLYLEGRRQFNEVLMNKQLANHI